MAWPFSKDIETGGRFQLVITKLTAGGRRVDVSTVRGVPTQISSFSSADPFGDSTAVFSFPAITPFDDLDAADLGQWLGYYSNVDLYWVPAVPTASQYANEIGVINPLTNAADLVTPVTLRDGAGAVTGVNAIKIWEGFLTAMDFSATQTSVGLEIQCQGALFQLDRYLQKPFYPVRPWPLELLIADCFDPKKKPHLRTQPLSIHFPDSWTKTVPHYSGSPTIYTPVAQPGSKWTGYSTRQTGSWEHTLTGFIQDLLTNMIVDDSSGVRPGNQWTIQNYIQGPLSSTGRQPVLLIRDRFRTPDFSMWLGTPGMEVQLSGDSTQSENVIYGDGTSVDGTQWRNAVINNDGSYTSYAPLAASTEVYPYDPKTALAHKGAFASEAFTKFGPGFDQPSAVSVAKQSLTRDQQPGWSGTITLRTDPSLTMSRWQIRAGYTMLLLGAVGTGEAGLRLHISAVQANPQDGTVQLTVDTRYRDLLTVEEALSRSRDPLTPVRMLLVNKASMMIEDLAAPWDYNAGSGFIPRASKDFHAYCPTNQLFAYGDWARKHPPLKYPSWYVKCVANHPTRAGRWAGPIPILMSERGTITRTEIQAYDLYGRVLQVPFHVSFYYYNVTVSAMPRDAEGPSPYINNAFESIDPATGLPWGTGLFLSPDPSFILGWGNQFNGIFNRAGFSPGRETNGDKPTGALIDEGTWTFDVTQYHQFFHATNKPGERPASSDMSIYAMFYCEYTQPVYFMGRLFRQNQSGTGA